MTYKEEIQRLLSDPELLLQKKPFTRGGESYSSLLNSQWVELNEMITATLPSFREATVPQEQFKRELDPNCHDILFDDNIPSICVKLKNNQYQEIHFSKMAVSLQRNIKDKKVLHLTGNRLQFTQIDTDPTEMQKEDFILFKQYWDMRNQDGMKTKMVDTQLSYGDAGLLYYMDYKGRIKSRLLSFDDGYKLCPHNDKNGDRILESVYYIKDGVEYIDSYDDTFMYRYTKDNNVTNKEGGNWRFETPIRHGFDEIPLITKRGDVAWNNVQNMITSYEILYNIFNAIQRRLGWGLLWIKGKFKDSAKKIAGSVILNDVSPEGNGDAKFLTPPTPQGMIDTLQLLLDNIQLGSSTTFILPKDIKTGGDISGITIQLVQSQDINAAHIAAIEWQNVADKMVRLFKQGLAMELVNNGTRKTAITDFENLHIHAKFKVWRPMNDYEYNNMLISLSNAGLISTATGVEKNTESAPDENARLSKQHAGTIITDNSNANTNLQQKDDIMQKQSSTEGGEA